MEYNKREDCNKFITPAGDQFEPIYEGKLQKDGTIVLEEVGKRDVKQFINSWKEQTDMAFILRGLEEGTYKGREDVVYGDFTEVPDNMIESMQLMIDAENAFYKLPLDTRNKFNNNFKQWLLMAQSEPEKFMSMHVKEEIKEPLEEVKNIVSE